MGAACSSMIPPTFRRPISRTPASRAMTAAEDRMTRRLRISGALIILGLVVEALSLIRIHPLAFFSFMFIGGGLPCRGHPDLIFIPL
jgi:hypothetical protein